MLREDLAEAGIEPVDVEGTVLDFHGQRTTFITSLARAGVSPTTAQRLARHSDMKLTMGTYTHLEVMNLIPAVEKLPDLRPAPTGNDDPRPGSETARQADIDDPQLGQVVRAWPSLSDETRHAIHALIAGDGDVQRPST